MNEISHKKKSVSFLEFGYRLVFSALKLAIKLALQFEISIKKIHELSEMAYFEELRKQNKTLKEIADILQITPRTAANYHNKFKSDFFAPENIDGLAYRIETALYEKKKLHLSDIERLFHEEEPQELSAALKKLIKNECIEIELGMYKRSPKHSILLQDEFDSKIAGFNNQINTIYETVWNRIVNNDKENSMARTFKFESNTTQIKIMNDAVVEFLRDQVITSEKKIAEQRDTNTYELTIALTKTHKIQDS